MTLQLSILPLIAEGEALRDAGIQQAQDHADSAAPYNWSDKAYEYTKAFIASKPCGYQFQVEDIRMKAENERKVMPPPSKRAWGGVIVKIKNEKLIQAIGTAPVLNPKAHRCFSTLWEVL